MAYDLPDADVVAIIDAPPTPASSPSPDGRSVLLVAYESHPPVALLARSTLHLAGARIDPQLQGAQRTLRLVGITVVDVLDGTHRRVELPEGRGLGMPRWSPDSSHFAFSVDEDDHVALWVGDRVSASAGPVDDVVVNDVLTGAPYAGGAAFHWSRDSASLLVLTRAGGGSPALDPPSTAAGPHTEETSGKRTQMATFQDLLASEADADRFEALATSQIVRVDVASGRVTPLGGPGLLRTVDESPDASHLLVHRIERPFSFRVPFAYFTRRVEVWSPGGNLVATVASTPVSDEVPRQGVPSGRRHVEWQEAEPAALIWLEALDGGDPTTPADHRDRVVTLAAPFADEPHEALRTVHRCVGWYELEEPGRLLVVEHDRDRRWQTTTDVRLADPAAARVVFDGSVDDAYGDPGTPISERRADGAVSVIQHGSCIYLDGAGSGSDGDRPFVDRFDLETHQAHRVHESPDDAHEEVVTFVDRDPDVLLLRRQTSTEPPNLEALDLRTGTRRRITDHPDPHPALTGMAKRFVTHDRGDGVQLTGKLHLPPGYEPERDGPLPLVLWAYPLDYSDAGTAGQVRGSTRTFTRLSALQPIWFVLRGFAVLAEATMPVIGDPETMNDTYVEQISMAAGAHIAALAAEGIADPARVLVGGHSYGAFMTANLLAHTDLFVAGIARSGAYNRTLTPFGFQAERRSFWEAPAVYDGMSPFRYADRITTPILLVHGADDANSGTFPLQSERLFQAIQGTGGTARLVILPHESHGYAARESVLHVLAEQLAWARRWAGAGDPPG